MATSINLFDNESSLTVQIKGKKTKMANFIASFATECYEDGEDLILFFNEKDKEQFAIAISVNKPISTTKIEGLEPVPYKEPAPPKVPEPKKKPDTDNKNTSSFIEAMFKEINTTTKHGSAVDEINQKILFGLI